MRIFVVLFLSIFYLNNLVSLQYENAYEYLDRLAIEANTDKSSNYHNYTAIYAKYFDQIKNDPIKFLEIGIYQGNSVKLWENYFKNADLHFFDITFGAVQYFSKRSSYYLVNQENPEDLLSFIRLFGGDFDVIIDDGGHTMQQQIVSFQTLFPFVKSGGIYVIEDLHTSYWSHFGGGGHENTTIAFLKNLVDDVNFVGNSTTKARHIHLDPAFEQTLNIYQRDIESIHFYDSVAIILKR